MKRTLQVVKATQGGLTSVKFNDNHILTGHANNAITHWDIRYSKWDQEVLYAHKGAVTCLGFDRTKMISGSLDSTVRLWDFSSGFHHAERVQGGPDANHETIHFSHFKRMDSNSPSKVCGIL